MAGPPVFTAPARGRHPGEAPPLERWEEVLREERSTVYAAAFLLSRLPLARRLIGPVPRGVSLHEREAALEAMRARPLYRALERVAGRGRRGREPASAGELGPLTSRELDAAIDLLRTLPFQEIQRRGWHFQPNHFNWPLNDLAFLDRNRELWHDRGLPKGVRWQVERQLELARELDRFRGELSDVPRFPRPGAGEFAWENWSFDRADALVYYGLVRSLQPRRVIEVGAGWSSLLLARAVERNERPCEVTLIEPNPGRVGFSAQPPDWRVREAILQQVELGLFDELEDGDVCFFDGSHCVRTASDVNWFVFEVMPRLAPGVHVHVHDILFPEDYVDRWIFEEGLSWNEQYLIQAFLMHNDAYEVAIANHLLYCERRAEIDELHGEDGHSLWLRKLVPPER